jgi:protein ImuA
MPIPAPPLLSTASAALPALGTLEEVAACEPQDLASATAFALWRALEATRAGTDRRPVAVIATPAFLHERGRPFGWGARRLGLDHGRLILVSARRESDVLWAFEEMLKSGAVLAALGALASPGFVATRRLEFAARAGGAHALALRAAPPGDLSAARRRWRVASAPSGPHLLDAQAPGPARLEARLARSPDGKAATFLLEQDHETGRFRLAAGLADHGLAAGQDGVRRAA